METGMIASSARWSVLCVVLAASLGACGGSSSAPQPTPVEVLDQDSGLASANLSPVYDQVDRAQTFTVGETGLLSKIALMLYEDMPAGANLVVDVRQTTGGAPNESDAINNVLLTFGVSAGALVTAKNEYVTFEVGQYGVQVTAGEVLAIVLRAPGGASTGYDWSAAAGNAYPAGAHFYRDHAGANLWTESSGVDHGFRTYVVR